MTPEPQPRSPVLRILRGQAHGGAIDFRDQFPALRAYRWFATPGVAPAAAPVAKALRQFTDEWEAGSFDWRLWETQADETRALFARLIGAAPDSVSLVQSLADGASTVARSVVRHLQPGHILVAEQDFRSTTMCWQQAVQGSRELRCVSHSAGGDWTDDVTRAITRDTALVAISEVQSASGRRLRMADVRERCSEVGARLFVNGTQSVGIIDSGLVGLGVDYLAVHGYKWLLAPRGAAWLYVRADRLGELSALAPNWKNAPKPYDEMYGLPIALCTDARSLDASLAWPAWAGAAAALRLMSSLPSADVQAHCLALAGALSEQLRQDGWDVVEGGTPTHVVGVYSDRANDIVTMLAQRSVVATARAGVVRFGCHYFNNLEDILQTTSAMRRMHCA